MLFNET
jgi:hypothetical protein